MYSSCLCCWFGGFAISALNGLEQVTPRGFEAHVHIGKLESDRLMLDDGLAALDAVTGVIESVLEGLSSTARSRLEQLIVCEGLKPSTTVQVLDGPIGKTICNAAANINADLLFVGCRGQGRLRGMMLGSSSQYCLRYSPVPVLAVRP